MSIVTRSYFVENLLIAEALNGDPDKNLLGNGESLKRFIARYEREILIKALGYSLYKLFMAEFDVDAEGNHTIQGAAAQKWKDLLNGAEYQLAGRTVNWRGLIFNDTIIPAIEDPVTAAVVYNQSLIANYIFCKYVTETDYQHSGIGFQTEQAKNASRVIPTIKYVNSYNTMYGLLYSEGNTERSLRQFIQDKNTADPLNYPNWEMEHFELINRFGI